MITFISYKYKWCRYKEKKTTCEVGGFSYEESCVRHQHKQARLQERKIPDSSKFRQLFHWYSEKVQGYFVSLK